MPKRVDYATQTDFTAGLYLGRNEAQLDDRATPDCLNVDFDNRGGFYLRRGVNVYRDAELAGTIHSLLPFIRSGGQAEVLVGASTGLYRWDGGSWTSIFTGISGPYRSVTYKDRIYVMAGGSNKCQRWDGSSNVALDDPAAGGGNWNDDISNPTTAGNGYFPKAKVAATYQNVVFVGNVTEDATNYPCRIRWSHPGFPEDWMSYHYIDIEPEDGDQITALVPMQDRLIVFKRNSVHAIYGSPPESLTVSPIARDVGAASQEAVASTDIGVFFWHEASGLHHLTSDPTKGTRTTWVWEPLHPAVEDSKIPAANMEHVQIGWINRRVWVSTHWEASATRARTFVYDPWLGKKGAWTQYDLELGPYLDYTPPGGGEIPLAAHASGKRVLRLEIPNQHYDSFDGSTETHIKSHYRTRWWDVDNGVVKCRWKRPQILMLGGQDSDIVVSAYRNYDPTNSYKTFHLITEAPDTAGVWDVDDWDDAVWGAEAGDKGEIKRGSPLGNATSVCLKFSGPSTNLHWRVDALSLKWVAKRVRN